jgi:hypothetical protein
MEPTVLTMRVPFPFMPAGWPGVLSVSASDGLTSYSNDGEEKLDGTATYASIPVKGTSFASPRLAAALGVYEYMTGANASCAASLDYNDLLQFSNTHRFENKAVTQATNSDCPHT